MGAIVTTDNLSSSKIPASKETILAAIENERQARRQWLFEGKLSEAMLRRGAERQRYIDAHRKRQPQSEFDKPTPAGTFLRSLQAEANEHADRALIHEAAAKTATPEKMREYHEQAAATSQALAAEKTAQHRADARQDAMRVNPAWAEAHGLQPYPTAVEIVNQRAAEGSEPAEPQPADHEAA